jgi:hydroxymethylpyrimidine/phosphomethylpyrimidine kinase
MSAVTAVTAQNSRGVHRIDLVPVEGLVAQLRAVLDDFPVGAIKIGMLGTAAHATAVADVLERLSPLPPLVVDPVMVATTGHRLLEPDAEVVIADRLLPLATVSTPNLAEAAVLAGAGNDVAEWARAQRRPVLITGGDAPGDVVVDLLFRDGASRRIAHPRIGTGSFHGTGCTLASAVAARLAHGDEIEAAVTAAIAYVRSVLIARTDGPANAVSP